MQYLINDWLQAINNRISGEELKERIKRSYPPLLSLCFTRRCVLNCKHCVYPKASREDLELQDLKRLEKIVAAGAKVGIKNLVHIGRILEEKQLPILKKAIDLGLNLSLIDNGNGGRLVEKMKRMGIYFKGGVDVSIDGDKESHEKQRGKGSFDLAINGINKLRKVSNHVSVTATASKVNYKGIVKGLVGLRKRLPFVKVWHISTVSPTRFQKERMHLTKKEMKIVFDDFIQATKKAPMTLGIYRFDDLKVIIEELVKKFGKPKTRYISLEWKINKGKIKFFPPSIVVAEEIPIDANGRHFLSFGGDWHLNERPEKLEMPDDLILKNPDLSYEKVVDKYWSVFGKGMLEEEKEVLRGVV
jgi:MoaA/NifB/PqqE/SkfB family radical SAM enzyme